MTTLYSVGANKVYYRPSGDVWQEFPTQPPTAVSLAPGILAHQNSSGVNVLVVQDQNLTPITWYHWNGTSWDSVQDVSTPSGVQIQRYFALNDNIYYGISQTGGIWKYSSSTNTWDYTGGTVSLTGVAPPTIWASSENDVWAAGGSGGGAEVILHWNGSTWTNRYSELPGVSLGIPIGLFGFSSNDVWVGCPGGLFYYNGSTWTNKYVPTSAILHDVWGTDNNNIWVFASGVFDVWGYIDYWNGTIATRQINLSGPYWAFNIFLRIRGVSSQEIYALHHDGWTRTDMLETSDGGSAWADQSDALLPSINYLTDLQALSEYVAPAVISPSAADPLGSAVAFNKSRPSELLTREIGNLVLPPKTQAIGPVVIGRLERGPALRPIKVHTFDEFKSIFGEPMPGAEGGDIWRDGNCTAPTYAAYAAQAWLRNNTPLTVVRLIGAQHAEATTAGLAGWQTQDSIGTFNGIGPNDSDGGAYGLFIADSSSVDNPAGANNSPATGTLAAIWYFNEGSITLTGSGRGNNTTFSGSAVLVTSLGTDKEFRAEIRDTNSNITRTTTFNFNRNSSKYIRKVFNTDPILTNLDVSTGANTASYWLGETYERFLNQYVTGSTQYGVILGLRGDDGTREQSDYKFGAREPQSGWIFSQDVSSVTGSANSYQPENMTKLFRFIGIDIGEYVQSNFKISIYNIQPSTNAENPYGTFSVLIRRAQDSDNVPKIVEQYDGLNLNPYSLNYIAARIGDAFYTWDDNVRRYREYGNYPNISKLVRMEMNPDVDAGTTNPILLPFGFFGPVRHKGFSILSGSAFYDLYTVSSASANEFDEVFIKGGASSPASARANVTDSNMVNLGAGASQYTASYLFPSFILRSSSAGGKPYWGIDTALNTTSLRHDPGYKDLVRPLPAGYDSFTPDNVRTEYSFIFTLDDIYVSASQGIYVSGSRAVGSSITAQSASNYAAILSLGHNKFTLPLHGGFAGLDILEREPFNNTDLNGGTITTNYAFNSIKRAIDSIADPELVEINLATMPGITNVPLTDHLANVCEQRGDTLAIIDLEGGFVPDTENTLGDDAIANRGEVETTIQRLTERRLNTSYACAYYPWVQVRDTVNGASFWSPPSVVALGAMSSCEKKYELWFAPAGYTRGNLSKGSAGIPVIESRQMLTAEERDKLYEANINPIATLPENSIVIFGQKTLQLTSKAYDRINVRRLMIFVKKEVSRMAATILFDQNIKVTQNRFLGKIYPFLEGIQVKLGLTDWKVVIKEGSSTPTITDKNILYIKVFLKPAEAIEFIAIDFTITNSAVDFED
jgi:hypothetical protein